MDMTERRVQAALHDERLKRLIRWTPDQALWGIDTNG